MTATGTLEQREVERNKAQRRRVSVGDRAGLVLLLTAGVIVTAAVMNLSVLL